MATKKKAPKKAKARAKAKKASKKPSSKKTSKKASKKASKEGPKKASTLGKAKTTPKPGKSGEKPVAPKIQGIPASTVELKAGQMAPSFELTSDTQEKVTLEQFRGKKIVLYFYPKDDTPGCTKEACDFRDSMNRIQNGSTVVLGVSKDTVALHQKFKQKYHLNFPLLADPEAQVLRAYGVWKEKQNYGRSYMGIERTTFLIDSNGKIRKIYAKVKVDGHVSQVLKDLAEI
jgi:peroxiredoxin Q/BCP